MREIKFRAWSIKDDSYINGCNMYGFTLGQGAPEESLERYDSKWKKGEFLLEQFTGLKDKNGVKIYEGDIVTYKIYMTALQKFPTRKMAWVWSEHHCGFTMKDMRGDDYGYEPTIMMPQEHEIEVIGNIHEKKLCP